MSRALKRIDAFRHGAPPLSDFRLAKRLSSIRARVPAITGLDALYVHFVDVERELTAAESRVLDALLEYGPRAERDESPGAALLVVPRFGTVSPWSSKATDIAHVCGLTAVRRIERGVRYCSTRPGPRRLTTCRSRRSNCTTA